MTQCQGSAARLLDFDMNAEPEISITSEVVVVPNESNNSVLHLQWGFK